MASENQFDSSVEVGGGYFDPATGEYWHGEMIPPPWMFYGVMGFFGLLTIVGTVVGIAWFFLSSIEGGVKLFSRCK